MRLNKIKLVGFKSFVDSTVLHFPANRVAVVGPNGCGKSNIIDAVRWVMGESSARSLRGETMADVIFNGAAGRKPVGQASIELVFDNNQGRLSGTWASYSEIAVRRLIGRDGQSTYFLNGTRCRRRDIADLFLGTGLGARSYAIIEQGTISRVVEARPEELRAFLEEAAGISRYKERRREAETRIRHTRENLDRLDDLREELGRQIQRLQRQVKAAEQYRDYRAQERRLRAELLTLRWRGLQADVLNREQSLNQQETALEALVSEQRKVETGLERRRTEQMALNDRYNEIQGRYYQSGAEISRLEQHIEHQRELQQRREDDWHQIAVMQDQLDEQRIQDQMQCDELATALAATEVELAQALAAKTSAEAMLTDHEAALRDGQVVWEAFGHRKHEAQRQADMEQARIEHLDRQALQNERRLEQLDFERTQFDDSRQKALLAECRKAVELVTEKLEGDQAQLTALDSERSVIRELHNQANLKVQSLREQQQIAQGQLMALRTLHEAAMGCHQGSVKDWLAQHGFAQCPRLVEKLAVAPGWEAAVEAVLADFLDAVCVSDLDKSAHAIETLTEGQLTLLEMSAVERSMGVGPLATNMEMPWSLPGAFAKVSAVTTFDEALMRRAGLKNGEVLVTPEGVLCGRSWLRWSRGSEVEGVLAREREIHELESALAGTAVALEQALTEIRSLDKRLHEHEQACHQLQQHVHQGYQAQVQAMGQLQAAQARREADRSRCAAVATEYKELGFQVEQDREQLQVSRERLEEALSILATLSDQQADMNAQREQQRHVFEESRVRAETARQTLAGQQAVAEALRARLSATRQALQRLDAQKVQLQQRKDQLAAEQTCDAGKVLAEIEIRRDEWLEIRLLSETELQQAREALDACDTELKMLEQERSNCERQAQKQRYHIEEQRLALGELRVHRQHLCEQLRELETEPETLLPTLPEHAAENDWVTRLEQLEQRIQRLGPINLASIEEYAQCSERKQYLDAQNVDLLAALATLEDTIGKIDRETRNRFRDTFNQVNAGLKMLFPRLFGGGQAYLELTGDDVLDAKVMIMAKPPGKRIGSIGLMSGGEKALTAMALVFAIFQLNPAPFCLLDEVDAPLDEANVGRFGSLVKDLSAHIQFIFITHNKATMEIADYLIGVTMQEPGVSRLVAVDMDAAVRWLQ
ncbi:MAG: chromosome segregation protein SMC [Candidatus Contendobacter odensis]|uniref:Chromosome partition protein Smc n=1 Tax=Candidatus Contendibacter odensensis TaxID=1400860 RepID=A0A2G6PET7_9GAMM|nr:MAG: chromosome segregation protein SMC [Candidatus Contendobacter odensis]